MRFSIRVSPLAAWLAGSITAIAAGQSPPPEATPTPAQPVVTVPASAPVVAAPLGGPGAEPAPGTAAPVAAVAPPPAPTPMSAMRITDPPLLSIAHLPTDNPFGTNVQAPAALPPKLNFVDTVLTSGVYVSVRVDPTGKTVSARRERDPIPSVSAEVLKSLARWTFTPARRGGQAVDTWGAFRLELSVEIRAPKILQMSLVPVTPSTPIATPLPWPSDNEWLESRKPAPPTDGTVPIDQVDTAPIPQKTPWSADSYKGPFSVKFWAHVDKYGHIDKAAAIEASDPVLIPYFRRSMSGWVLKPAQGSGGAVESWNELTLSGQISYSDEIKQIAALRRPIAEK
jgi:hypothetical protein